MLWILLTDEEQKRPTGFCKTHHGTIHRKLKEDRVLFAQMFLASPPSAGKINKHVNTKSICTMIGGKYLLREVVECCPACMFSISKTVSDALYSARYTTL